jgi:hypothetical protein
VTALCSRNERFTGGALLSKTTFVFIEIETIFVPVHFFFVPFCVLANSLHTRLSMGTSSRPCDHR